jgi:phage shock protein C
LERDFNRKETTMDANRSAVVQTRRLYRSRTDRKLAGVCGGLAQYFNTDATLMRVLFVILALLGGPGLVIYLVLWIVVPEEPEDAA